MRDEAFSYFIKKFNEATHHIQVPDEEIKKWQGRLPEQLLFYWKTEGWNTYQNGLFSIVNPDDYEDIIDDWLDGTPFEEKDAYHVIARSAFGDLYVFGEKTGKNLTICCSINQIISDKKRMKVKSKEDLDEEIRNFFAMSRLVNCDMIDDHKEEVFKKALKKHGELSIDEIYGFEPAIVLGGNITVENVKKLNYSIHLNILRQLAEPKVFDI